MKEFVKALGGLIGVGLIGIVFILAIIIADRLMIKSQGKRGPAKDDETPP